jgi:hypothetical protein
MFIIPMPVIRVWLGVDGPTGVSGRLKIGFLEEGVEEGV